MTEEDFIILLFWRVDDAMLNITKHSQSHLYPSELVTIGLLFAWKGEGERAFYRWLKRNFGHWFPRLPERTRLFRALTTHRDWAERFLVEPSLLSVADTYGIELLHPRREGRSDTQLGAKGSSNLRWIVGAKFAFVLDHVGRFVGRSATRCQPGNRYSLRESRSGVHVHETRESSSGFFRRSPR